MASLQLKYCFFFTRHRADQILHSVSNGSPLIQHLRKNLCRLGAMSRRWAPQTRYTLRRHSASTWKVWFLVQW